jgi:Fe-S-cluster-containing hydrogenase component 2
MTCGLCREACPTGVLAGTEWSVALDGEGCVGCGLCAASCPTGALKVEGCTPHVFDAAGEPIVLECRRVADADRDPDAVVVPCLGGLTTPDLLDLVEQADAPIVIADRGWCATCAVGRCGNPWQVTFDEAKSALAAVDARLAAGLTVRRDDLPAERARPIMAALRPDRHVGRREFLRRFVTPAQPHDALAESRRVVSGRGHVAPIKRRRILDRVESLAADVGQSIPASLVPAIKLADCCRLDGLCSAICPTGALRREEAGDSVSLQFDAADCIACGLCQRVCASQSLSLWPDGDGRTLGEEPETLVKRRTVRCANCEESFVPAGDEALCTQCVKTTALMHELRSLRFGMAAPSG